MPQELQNECVFLGLESSKAHLTLTERNPRKLPWTKSFRKAAGKEMPLDGTLAIAAKRNVPIRYNRELMKTTMRAIGRVEEIRAKREELFFKMRMAGNKKRTLEQDRKLVAENQHLLPPSERDVPLTADQGMSIAEDLIQDVDAGMWEGIEDDPIAVPTSMDLEQDDEDGDDSDEQDSDQDIDTRLRLTHKATTSKSKQKLEWSTS
jgi:large subunit ribosomal protein L24e